MHFEHNALSSPSYAMSEFRRSMDWLHPKRGGCDQSQDREFCIWSYSLATDTPYEGEEHTLRLSLFIPPAFTSLEISLKIIDPFKGAFLLCSSKNSNATGWTGYFYSVVVGSSVMIFCFVLFLRKNVSSGIVIIIQKHD